jgi:hypothetical protein
MSKTDKFSFFTASSIHACGFSHFRNDMMSANNFSVGTGVNSLR